MEGISHVESMERGDAWHTLKNEAPAQAAEFVASIPGFEHMDADTQIATLEAYIDTLTSDNNNRFLATEVARTIETIRAKAVFENRMRALEVVA